MSKTGNDFWTSVAELANMRNNTPQERRALSGIRHMFQQENTMNTTFDFQDGNGPVPAHRHKNPDGSEGGWVAETASVSKEAFIGRYALVYGRAGVSGHAQIRGTSRISGIARVPDGDVVYGRYSEGFINSDYWNAEASSVESHRQNLLKALDLKDDSSMEDIIKLVESMHIAASRHTQQIHVAEATERSWQAKFQGIRDRFEKLTETCLDQASQIRELRERLARSDSTP